MTWIILSMFAFGFVSGVWIMTERDASKRAITYREGFDDGLDVANCTNFMRLEQAIEDYKSGNTKTIDEFRAALLEGYE